MFQVIKDLLDKTSVANVVAAFVVIAGMSYAMWQKDTNLVTFLAGAGVGYLLKEVRPEG